MHLFLCGRGTAAKRILGKLVQQSHWRRHLAVFTDDAELTRFAHENAVYATDKTINDVDAWPFKPGIIASVGYLHIIKPHVLALVPRTFNCHYALLPNHRGRSSVPWAILDGDTYGGITYHVVDAGIDTGRILLQAVAQIDTNETQTTLFDKLHWLAEAYWDTALHLAWSGYPGVSQIGRAQYHHAGPPHDGVIHPDWHATKVERFIRAMTYPPLPYATYKGQEIRRFEDWLEIRHREYHHR